MWIKLTPEAIELLKAKMLRWAEEKNIAVQEATFLNLHREGDLDERETLALVLAALEAPLDLETKLTEARDEAALALDYARLQATEADKETLHRGQLMALEAALELIR